MQLVSTRHHFTTTHRLPYYQFTFAHVPSGSTIDALLKPVAMMSAGQLLAKQTSIIRPVERKHNRKWQHSFSDRNTLSFFLAFCCHLCHGIFRCAKIKHMRKCIMRRLRVVHRFSHPFYSRTTYGAGLTCNVCECVCASMSAWFFGCINKRCRLAGVGERTVWLELYASETVRLNVICYAVCQKLKLLLLRLPGEIDKVAKWWGRTL